MTDIARCRLRNQRLVSPSPATPDDVVRWLGAVQSQDYAGAKWAVAQRTPAATDADVEQALDGGRILRTHVLRPTWHFVVPDDIRWMLALSAPRVRAALAYYDRKLDLDQHLLGKAKEVFAGALQGGRHATRAELSRALENAKIRAQGQKLGHMLMHAELDALICSGARRGKQFTYALLDERSPRPRSTLRGDEALAELTKRYFSSHGPAQPVDFAWWSGLTVADAKRGIELAGRSLVHDVVQGKTYWRAASPAPRPRSKTPSVVLLPNFDEYLVAYKDRSASVDPTIARRVNVRGDIFAGRIVVVNGRVAGAWRRTLERKPMIVEIALNASLGENETRALVAGAKRFARFAGLVRGLRTVVKLKKTGRC